MKLRKLTALLMAFAMTILLLTGCGASSKGVAMDMAMPEAAPMEAPMMEEMKAEGAEATMIFLHWGEEYDLRGNDKGNSETDRKPQINRMRRLWR